MIRFARPEKLSEVRRIVYSRDDARVNRYPLSTEFTVPDADGKTGKEHAAYKAAMEAFTKERDAYETGLFDVSLVAVKPGMRLTVFVIAPLCPDARAHLDTVEGKGKRIIETIAYGVTDVVDGEWTDRDGNVIPFVPQFIPNGPGGRRLASTTLDVLTVDEDLRLELFIRIREQNASIHPEVHKSDPGA